MLGDAYYQHTKCVGKNLSVIPLCEFNICGSFEDSNQQAKSLIMWKRKK